MVKNHLDLHIEKNAFVDSGDGTITFPKGLTITDESEQKNGTKYDIKSMDLSEYRGQVTADHIDSVNTLIGKVINVAKKGKAVVIDGIMFAVSESSTARLAYDLMRNGFLTDVSIETYGPMPNDDGVYMDAKLIGLSTVVVGNNNNATINEFVMNSIAEAKKDGLDTTELEKVFTKDGEVVDKKETNKLSEEKNMSDVKDDTAVLDKTENKEAEAKQDNTELLAAINSSLDAKIAPVMDKVKELEANAFDKSAKEPEFKKEENKGNGVKNSDSEFKSMDSEERTVLQINSAIKMLNHDYEAGQLLHKLNAYNFNELRREGIIKNSITIADMGNFVISPEQLSEIQGCRTNYDALVNATDWRETLSTQMAWISRSGDIDMQSVEFCDDDADGNLKPISEYGAAINTSNLEELAAVTPVCNAATRFLAADLLADVQQGYRWDYNRKRAQLVIARLEQAVEENGNSEIYNTSTAAGALVEPLALWSLLADCTPNGTFVMNSASYAELIRNAVTAGVGGPLAQLFTTGDIPQLFGRPILVVPNDLLPTLNTAQTKSFVVNGVTVTVNHAIFYADLSNFTGRVSGGLAYDIATQAAYEVGGEVKSAFQRNEIVLRGSFFRGGAIKDVEQVAGLLANGVSQTKVKSKLTEQSMTLEQYTELTGITVSTSQEAVVTAQIARTERILESLLGYTLESADRLTNLYIETGQTSLDCSCSNIEAEDLKPPDAVMYAYRLFSYNYKDKYLFVDSFTSLNKVKLVKDDITYKTFDEDDIRTDWGRDGIAKFIELCEGCGCDTDCTRDCLQLAVDADWCFATIPDDLLQVWADMVTFYSSSNYNIKSQTVLGHSYTLASQTTPQDESYNNAILLKYAGPYGTLARIPTQ